MLGGNHRFYGSPLESPKCEHQSEMHLQLHTGSWQYTLRHTHTHSHVVITPEVAVLCLAAKPSRNHVMIFLPYGRVVASAKEMTAIYFLYSLPHAYNSLSRCGILLGRRFARFAVLWLWRQRRLLPAHMCGNRMPLKNEAPRSGSTNFGINPVCFVQPLSPSSSVGVRLPLFLLPVVFFTLLFL